MEVGVNIRRQQRVGGGRARGGLHGWLHMQEVMFILSGCYVRCRGENHIYVTLGTRVLKG